MYSSLVYCSVHDTHLNETWNELRGRSNDSYDFTGTVRR